ncbi:MAG: restriction endonuclease subunit S [Lachnospiraceae bacterium]|nr:restriction endonuclease subunit S [Lachnospiraceae bacterium]
MDYKEYELDELLPYEQPQAYIVESTQYSDTYKTPVLTAGKSFILGYTNETEGIYEDLPVIIFDDFTTATQFVNFKFKVKSSAMKILHINTDLVLPKYIYYKLQTIHIDHSTHKRYWIQQFSKIKVAVPSIPEQQRIVSRIEELFSSLDNAAETLRKTKEQLAVYRQAVLKEAFDSAEEDCKMLPIAEILTKKRKGMSTGPFGTMIKKSDHKASGVPMLGIENIGRGQFVDGNKIFVTEEKAEELKSFSLTAGDIIISRSGTVGEICAVPERAEGSLLSTNLMRISLDNAIIRSDYFIALFQSKGIVLDQIKELCKGSTRDFLNQTILKQIIFPVPSIERQAEIVSIIEARMSVCDSIEQTVGTALAQAEAMRQSILKEAFEGRL